MFTVSQVTPEVSHIKDAMGVNFTLIEGTERAILFDTGYGTEDVHSFIRTLTEKPVTVILSHGHHDHMLGARWFEKTWLCTEDFEEFTERTGKKQRDKVMKQAEDLGVSLPGDFMTAEIRMPEAIRFTEKTGPYESRTEELGGLTVKVIHVPGHTPGSIVMYLPEEKILLTGDNWNPCTWMWFPTSEAANLWRDRMKVLIQTLESDFGSPIGTVVCSHQPMPREGAEIKSFLEYMTDEQMKKAPAVDMGAPIDTHQVVKGDWVLLFDQAKIRC
jgi:glyoxylase-like metal-dependent hydrolase (beta-lactamase superfamily II)